MKITPPKNWLSYGILAAIVAIGIALYCWVEAQFSITGKPSVDLLFLLAAFNLALYCWVRTKSSWSFRTQALVIGAAILIQGSLMASIQMQGLYGNGRPVFAWRWSSLPADRFESESTNQNGLAKIDPSIKPAWPQYRGINRDGISSEQIENWSHTLPELMWRKPIGAGWSSFAVADEYAFTLEQRKEDECLVCYRIKDGKQIWVNSTQARFSEISGGEGPRATPAFDDGRIYSLGATGILLCVDAASGETIWQTNILEAPKTDNCIFGMCGSPLVTDGKVIVSPGGKSCSLVSYDKLDGGIVWSGGSAPASYSSPVQMKICGVEQVLIFNGHGLFSHNLKTGSVLWHVDWISNTEELNNVCQPLQLDDDEVFISSAYGMGCARIKLKCDEGKWKATTEWRNKNLKSKFSSVVFDGDHIFGLDLGILVCIDAQTGTQIWKKGRYAHGQFIKAGEYLIIQSEKGFVAQVVAKAEKYEETARIKALRHRTWTHPVLADGVLLVRNDREMSAFRVKEKSE